MTEFQTYLWFVLLPGLDRLAFTSSTLSICSLGVWLVYYLIAQAEGLKESPAKFGVIVSASCLALSAFLMAILPNKTEVVAILGIPYLTGIEGASEIPQALADKLLNILEVEQ